MSDHELVDVELGATDSFEFIRSRTDCTQKRSTSEACGGGFSRVSLLTVPSSTLATHMLLPSKARAVATIGKLSRGKRLRKSNELLNRFSLPPIQMCSPSKTMGVEIFPKCSVGKPTPSAKYVPMSVPSSVTLSVSRQILTRSSPHQRPNTRPLRSLTGRCPAWHRPTTARPKYRNPRRLGCSRRRRPKQKDLGRREMCPILSRLVRA